MQCVQAPSDPVQAPASPKQERARPRPGRRILARSVDFAHDKGFIPIELSRPADGEECGVTLQPMSEARLDFLPEGLAQCPIASRRELLKGTLPCGHSFSALAILYHFAKNGMQCPNCRAGVPGRMTAQSIPKHLRAEFVRHMGSQEEADRREQTLDDMRTASELLAREVNALPRLIPVLGSVEAAVYAFECTHGAAPVSVQTIPLRLMPAPDDDSTSSPVSGGRRSRSGTSSSPSSSSPTTGGLLRFESSGFSCREMTRNLRLTGADVRCLEIVVGTRDVFEGGITLLRTERFEIFRGTHKEGSLDSRQSLEVWMQDGLERIQWSVPRAVLGGLLAAPAPRRPDAWLLLAPAGPMPGLTPRV